MKNYTITVNGTAYDVTVEEKGGSGVATAPVAAPVAAPKAAPAASGSAGSIKIESAVGTKVKAGDPIVVLEVMKMETPVVAPKDGVVASIEVSEGQAVEAGVLLATMNE